MKKLLCIALLVLPFQFAVAQTSQQVAELALAVEVANALNSDNDPSNDVAVPLTNEAAKAVIAGAPANVVVQAVSTVSAGAPDAATAAAVAAAAVVNNTGVRGRDVAAAVSRSSGHRVSLPMVAREARALKGSIGRTGATGFTGTGRGTGSRTGTGGAGGGALASDDATDLLVALGVDSETAIEIIEAIEEEGMSL